MKKIKNLKIGKKLMVSYGIIIIFYIVTVIVSLFGVYNVAKSLGIPEIMLIKSTIDIPLPTPFSVILSPSHISIAEPAVSAATTTIMLTI